MDLFVPDVAATREFFEKFLGFRVEATKGKEAMSILRDESGFLLIISKFRKDSPTEYPTDFHIGFHLETREAVREAHERLTAGGVESISPLAEMRGGLRFYCHAPGPLMIEVASNA
jgi:catechol 2,3-dioxygenase-like lactoylglutathione lyase family enzyme